jgi:hypothetical protein
MADPFPNIVPSSREFTMGDFPGVTYRSLSGVTFRRAYGNRQAGHRLSLQFQNIGDRTHLKSGSGTAREIINHYNRAKGTQESFTIPDNVFKGMDDTLEALIQAPSNVKWHYASPPQVRSVKSGVSTVRVELIGELNV